MSCCMQNCKSFDWKAGILEKDVGWTPSCLAYGLHTSVFLMFYFETIVDSLGVAKYYREVQCILHLVYFSGFFLHNYSTISKLGT